jgi:hypothetical protein
MSVLRVLAQLDPAVVGTGAPERAVLNTGVRTGRRLGDEVALDAQPLPPRERLLVETVAAARPVAEADIVIPRPRHWPHPWPPDEPYPIVEEIDQVARASQAAAGVAVESFAAGVQDERLSASFAGPADRLEEAAFTVGGG